MRRRLPLRHETDIRKYLGDVRCWVNSGKHLLSLSVSGVDLRTFDNRSGWNLNQDIIRGRVDLDQRRHAAS
jgi:hypothetical protein